jgi:hypothetical protein
MLRITGAKHNGFWYQIFCFGLRPRSIFERKYDVNLRENIKSMDGRSVWEINLPQCIWHHRKQPRTSTFRAGFEITLSPSELRAKDSVSVPHCQTGDLNLSDMSTRGSLYYRREQFSETVTNQYFAPCCKEVHTALSNFTLAKSVNTETHGTASALVKS